MRRLRYNVATSLDGFLAGPNGEYDWIVVDPTIDFAAIFSEFDTLLMGRKTFEVYRSQGSDAPDMGMKLVVVSSTLDPRDHPDLTVINEDVAVRVAAMKQEDGKDVWLFGGGVLFRTLLDAQLVDSIELAVMPVLLGQGIPLLPPGEPVPPLRLTQSKTLPSGIVRV